MMDSILGNFFSNYPFLTKFLNDLGDSVYIVDKDSRFVFINTAVEEVEGIRLEVVKGKTIHDVYQFQNTPLLAVLERGKPVSDFIYRYSVNGREVCQTCRAYPIVFDGKMVGAYAVQRDVTFFKEMIDENLSLYEQLAPRRKAMEVSQVHPCFDRIIGNDKSFLECVLMAASAAETDSSVLLTGPTGSGKEMFAKCIHEASSRSTGPFLAVNCAAIPETLIESILFGTTKGAYTDAVDKIGVFEQAKGGTLLLDEINSMPLSSQSKLLRVLEEKEVQHLGGTKKIKTDVRIISSSNCSPEVAIRDRQLREDLFYRLAVVNISIPSLAHRKSDILLLTDHFISLFNEKFQRNIQGITEEVKYFFLMFPWPGNIRQLKHCIESAMNFVGPDEALISKKHIPKYLFSEFLRSADSYAYDGDQQTEGVPQTMDNGTPNVFQDMDNEEKTAILHSLIKSKGNVTQAAIDLGISRHALVYRMKKYGIRRK
jgi:arginine utilization regulatory protein